MSSPNMVQRLQQFWLFQDLPEGQLVQVQGFFQPRVYSAGEVVFAQGDRPSHFCLVEKGTVIQTGRDKGEWEVLHRKGCRPRQGRLVRKVNYHLPNSLKCLINRDNHANVYLPVPSVF